MTNSWFALTCMLRWSICETLASSLNMTCLKGFIFQHYCNLVQQPTWNLWILHVSLRTERSIAAAAQQDNLNDRKPRLGSTKI